MGARTYPSFGRTALPARNAVAVEALLGAPLGVLSRRRGVLAYGNGRSYGDSCQPASGTVIDVSGMNRILDFDPVTGLMDVEAGVLLSEVIAAARPHGWFPAVVPGTQFVTVAGAIANDIHGKNHHRRGTFGRQVESLRLLDSIGIHDCSATSSPSLFAATIGGMGLTGVIMSARIRLMKVASVDVVERVQAFASLAAYFDLADAADRNNEYAVAWVDQLAEGAAEGRGLLITGNHADADAAPRATLLPKPFVPFQPPFGLLGRPFLTIFNRIYHDRKARTAERKVGHESFFFPLDGVRHWNRLYGPRGLFQHQSLIPEAAAHCVVPELLAATRSAGQASFLTVLKRFGNVASPGLLSFPRPGYTLTLDFPNRGAQTLALLARLDAITVEAGGAVNPYKDARMSADTFAASFPRWAELEVMRDPAFNSAFWERTALRLASRAVRARIAAE
ncbi:MAG: FAD-dependent oxidoreductase [Rhizobiaceae bacterium]